jgi:dolichol-phosphate mannosyltransferase
MKISVVIPCYNEEASIPLIYESLKMVLQDQVDYEIIFVNDGSSDTSLATIKAISALDKKVKCISLSRNFGHQAALVAGMSFSSGEYVITMDADLQHPPVLLHKMLELAKNGADIVASIRKNTEDASFIKRKTSSFFYTLLNKLSDTPIQEGAADFRLMNRAATNAFLSLPEKIRFNRGLVSWLGFNVSYLEYDAPKRLAGETKYSFSKMLNFALTGTVSFSSKPLQIPIILGIVSVILGLIYALFILIQFINGGTIEGWASTVILILFLGGAQMLSLGIVGIYVAKVYEETKQRPIFIVKEKINF